MEENDFYDRIESHENRLAQQVNGAAIDVHRTLGPGLLEHPYEECLCYELTSRKMTFTRQVVISVSAINDIHLAQMITYLKLTSLKLGLILNFKTIAMKSGIKRVVFNF